MSDRTIPVPSGGGPASWREAIEFAAADTESNSEPLSRMTMRLFRCGQWLERDRRLLLVPFRRCWWAVWTAWSTLVGIELWPSTHVGRGLRLRHGARGAVIHPRAVIGNHVVLFHGVTLGTRGRADSTPTIEDRVRLGAGAIVIGRVTVGTSAIVGAGAVVVHDVPAGATARGPAAIISPGPD